LSFNTVQGILDTGFRYTNRKTKKKRNLYSISTKLNYGFAEDRLRVMNNYTSIQQSKLRHLFATGGSSVQQFNPSEPISKIINSISSLSFKNNFMKLYNLESATIGYNQNVANGVNLGGRISYQQRNHYLLPNFSYFNKEDLYTSNNWHQMILPHPLLKSIIW
jgi:hypothetical protein